MGQLGGEASEEATAQVQRLDRWLWFSRMLKSRTMAAQLVEDGKVRVNRIRVVKPSHSVRAGDVLTIAFRGRVQVLKVLAPGARRGPSTEARQLYEMIQDGDRTRSVTAQRQVGAARPSKRDRRLIERFTGQK
jgi:ribosome-associated heat shock protein Hsp15